MTNEATNGAGGAQAAGGENNPGGGGAQGGSGDTAQSGGPAGGQPGPSVEVLAQYTKDLSFENPKAPGSMTAQREQSPQLNFNIQVHAQPVGENEVEVELRIEARAGDKPDVLFNLELVYAGVFRLQNIPQEHLQPFIMIECPRLLFPFARQVVAETISSGGFPPVMLGLIDFAALYQQRMAQQGGQPASN